MMWCRMVMFDDVVDGWYYTHKSFIVYYVYTARYISAGDILIWTIRTHWWCDVVAGIIHKTFVSLYIMCIQQDTSPQETFLYGYIIIWLHGITILTKETWTKLCAHSIHLIYYICDCKLLKYVDYVDDRRWRHILYYQRERRYDEIIYPHAVPVDIPFVVVPAEYRLVLLLSYKMFLWLFTIDCNWNVVRNYVCMWNNKTIQIYWKIVTNLLLWSKKDCRGCSLHYYYLYY